MFLQIATCLSYFSVSCPASCTVVRDDDGVETKKTMTRWRAAHNPRRNYDDVSMMLLWFFVVVGRELESEDCSTRFGIRVRVSVTPITDQAPPRLRRRPSMLVSASVAVFCKIASNMSAVWVRPVEWSILIYIGRAQPIKRYRYTYTTHIIS